jgi:ubiquitin-large subunit ribosomal protein L40e
MGNPYVVFLYKGFLYLFPLYIGCIMAKFKEAELRLFKGVCMSCNAKNPVDATRCRKCGKVGRIRRKSRKKAVSAQ